MNTTTRWLLSTLAAILWAASGAILDGPTDHEAAVDIAADIADVTGVK